MVTEAYDGTIGYDGRPRRETRMLCTNPITGIPDTEAPAEANIGTLKPEGGFKAGQLVAGQVGAKCDDARGFLMIGEAEAVKQLAPGDVLQMGRAHVGERGGQDVRQWGG